MGPSWPGAGMTLWPGAPKCLSRGVPPFRRRCCWSACAILQSWSARSQFGSISGAESGRIDQQQTLFVRAHLCGTGQIDTRERSNN